MQQNTTGFFHPAPEYIVGEQVPVTPVPNQAPQQQVHTQTQQFKQVAPNPIPQPIPKVEVKQEPVGSNGEIPKQGTVDIANLTPEQVSQFIEQLKPATMSNPVRVTQPSYVLTDEQMLYLLSLAQGQPVPVLLGDNATTNSGNVVDTLCNATLGTAGRLGHTLTGFVDGIIDILTLGYSSK